MRQLGIARCPRCDRTITTDAGRYKPHSLIKGKKHTCPMTDQHIPITGVTDADYRSRAYLVADLADQLQDRDPAIVWDYLTALPAVELQRLMVIALAGLPVHGRTVDEIFAWVTELPVAKSNTAHSYMEITG